MTPTNRRIDPLGKNALFTTPVTAAADQLQAGERKEGRSALFSVGAKRTGTVVVTCESCEVRSRVSLFDLGVRFVSVSAWLPGRRHPHWMRCPACHHHTWCQIGWNE